MSLSAGITSLLSVRTLTTSVYASLVGRGGPLVITSNTLNRSDGYLAILASWSQDCLIGSSCSAVLLRKSVWTYFFEFPFSSAITRVAKKLMTTSEYSLLDARVDAGGITLGAILSCSAIGSGIS